VKKKIPVHKTMSTAMPMKEPSNNCTQDNITHAGLLAAIQDMGEIVRLIGWREWAQTATSVDQSLVVPLSASIVRDMNRKWVCNNCRQFKLWINHPKLQTTKYFMSLPKNSSKFWVLLSRGTVALINIYTGWDWQQALFVHL
jgi:hypothetical protein